MKLFKSKRFLLELGFVHLLISSLLYYFGQYFFIIFLQMFFLFTTPEYKKSFLNNLFLFSYLMCLNYSLVLIFSFSSYILYFAALFALIYFIYKNMTCTKKEFFAFGILTVFATGMIKYFEESIFDVYIYLDITDKQNYFTLEVAILLSIMHAFILLFVLFKKDRELFGI